MDPACRFVDRNGILELDFRPCLDALVRLTPWEDGLQTLRWEPYEWEADQRDWQLMLLSSARRAGGDHPAGRLAATVPEEALRLARAAGTYELTGLRLLRHHAETWDLARTAPNLFWLLSAVVGAWDTSPEEHGELLRLRRVEILGRCTGVAASAASLRFVEKFVPVEHNEAEVQLLLKGAGDVEIAQTFRHHRRVTPELLRLATLCRPMLSHGFFQEALRRSVDASQEGTPLETAEAWEVVSTYRDTLRMAGQLHLDAGERARCLGAARTIAGLRALHDRWWQRVSEDVLETPNSGVTLDEPFPESGLIPPDGIEPIRTARGLVDEGRAMHHCVVTYVQQCIAGVSFVFRVLRPQRATLEVRFIGGRPLAAQLRGPCNATPSVATKAVVEEWIAGCNRK
jgi:hypothetical protein